MNLIAAKYIIAVAAAVAIALVISMKDKLWC